jgi:hypothetical protein
MASVTTVDRDECQASVIDSDGLGALLAGNEDST